MSQPDVGDILLDADQLAFTNKLLSSEALAAQIVDRIKRKVPTSVIRASDGERGFIRLGVQGAGREWYMNLDDWVRRYGVEGANFTEVGQALHQACLDTDYLGVPLAGLFWPCFNTYGLFPERGQFVDHFYPMIWEACGYVGPILRLGRVFVLHREFEAVLKALTAKHGIRGNSGGARLDSWRDHEHILATLPCGPGDIVLVSGGPSGKALCVNLARRTGAVVLDVGEAMGATWVTEARNHLDRFEDNKGRI